MNRPRTLLLAVLGAFVLMCVVAYAASYSSRPQGLITSDGKGYYAWLRSIALDGDMDFRNDYLLIFPPDPLPVDMDRRTSDGQTPNKYPVGVALVETPGFLVGHAVAHIVGARTDGVSAPYQFSVTLWMLGLCMAGLVALWAGVIRLGADPMIAAVVVCGALAATNLVHYAARPALAHAPGLAVLSFALYVTSLARERGSSLRLLAIIGALLGLAFIIRPSNVALAPFFLVLLLAPLGRAPRNWAVFTAPFVGMVAIQVTLMSLLWGRPTFSGYVDEGFTSGWEGIVSTLFAARHGLFIYHWWYLLMLVVVIFAARTSAYRSIANATLASFAALVVINGTWGTWWFGDSFGNRAFIEVILALAVTASLFLSDLARTRRRTLLPLLCACTLVLTVINGVLWSGYVLRRYPADGSHTVADAYMWPWR